MNASTGGFLLGSSMVYLNADRRSLLVFGKKLFTCCSFHRTSAAECSLAQPRRDKQTLRGGGIAQARSKLPTVAPAVNRADDTPRDRKALDVLVREWLNAPNPSIRVTSCACRHRACLTSSRLTRWRDSCRHRRRFSMASPAVRTHTVAPRRLRNRGVPK